jgi:hypothetical protein
LVIISAIFGAFLTIGMPEGKAAELSSVKGVRDADFWDARTQITSSGISNGNSSSARMVSRASSVSAFATSSATGSGGWHYEFDPNASSQVATTPFTFTFALSGSSIGSIENLAFLALLPYEASQSRTDAERYFAARFDRASQDGKATSPASSGPPTISEPATLLMLGTGLIGLARYAWPRSLAQRALR